MKAERLKNGRFVKGHVGYKAWLGKKRPDISEQQRKKLLEEPISYWKGKKIPTYARKKMSEVRLLN